MNFLPKGWNLRANVKEWHSWNHTILLTNQCAEKIKRQSECSIFYKYHPWKAENQIEPQTVGNFIHIQGTHNLDLLIAFTLLNAVRAASYFRDTQWLSQLQLSRPYLITYPQNKKTLLEHPNEGARPYSDRWVRVRITATDAKQGRCKVERFTNRQKSVS